MSNQFNFKYTALSQEERREIDSIRRRYVPEEKTETKMERIRRLDSLVKNTAMIWSLCLGIVGTLIFGLGLTMILEWSIFLWGIALMAIGSVSMAVAYPVYKEVLKKYKKRYGAEIVKLSEEILNENDENK